MSFNNRGSLKKKKKWNNGYLTSIVHIALVCRLFDLNKQVQHAGHVHSPCPIVNWLFSAFTATNLE